MTLPPAIVVGTERSWGAACRTRGLLDAGRVRAVRAGARRDMLWRADDPAPGLAAIDRAVSDALGGPLRRVQRSRT